MGIRIALVSGANSGLGFETARQLARRGYRVVLAARDLDKAEIAAETLRDAGVLVNSVCPGWAKTDMEGSQAQLEPEEGVATIVSPGYEE